MWLYNDSTYPNLEKNALFVGDEQVSVLGWKMIFRGGDFSELTRLWCHASVVGSWIWFNQSAWAESTHSWYKKSINYSNYIWNHQLWLTKTGWFQISLIFPLFQGMISGNSTFLCVVTVGERRGVPAYHEEDKPFLKALRNCRNAKVHNWHKSSCARLEFDELIINYIRNHWKTTRKWGSPKTNGVSRKSWAFSQLSIMYPTRPAFSWRPKHMDLGRCAVLLFRVAGRCPRVRISRSTTLLTVLWWESGVF